MSLMAQRFLALIMTPMSKAVAFISVRNFSALESMNARRPILSGMISSVHSLRRLPQHLKRLRETSALIAEQWPRRVKTHLTMPSAVTIYLVHHPECKFAEELTSKLFIWFRLGYLTGDSCAAGIPVYFRRHVVDSAISPKISFSDASINIVVLLADEHLTFDSAWRKAVVKLSEDMKHVQTKGTER